MKWSGTTQINVRIVVAVIIATMLVGACIFTRSASAETPTQFTFEVYSEYYHPQEQMKLWSCRISSTGNYAEFQITVPAGVVIPGSECNGQGFIFRNWFAQNPAGTECFGLYGYVLHEGYYTFKAKFYEPSTGLQTEIVKVAYLVPVGNPKVTNITPQGALPGQEITIEGNDFLPLAYGESVSGLQVWFIDRSTGGVSSLDYYHVRSWEANRIVLSLPHNLWHGRMYDVSIMRGSVVSTVPLYEYTVGTIPIPTPTPTVVPSPTPTSVPTVTPVPQWYIGGKVLRNEKPVEGAIIKLLRNGQVIATSMSNEKGDWGIGWKTSVEAEYWIAPEVYFMENTSISIPSRWQSLLHVEDGKAIFFTAADAFSAYGVNILYQKVAPEPSKKVFPPKTLD